jgi:transposase
VSAGPSRRQAFLLPPDRQDWLPHHDFVPLVPDAVSLMDRSADEEDHRVGSVGEAPCAPSMLVAVLIHAHGRGVTANQAIERLCRRDAGCRSIVCAHVSDHTVIARFRRRHIDKPAAVFATVLRICYGSGLIRRGLVVLDGTKVTASASLDANRSAAMSDEQVRRMLAKAERTDQGEDRDYRPQGREGLAPAPPAPRPRAGAHAPRACLRPPRGARDPQRQADRMRAEARPRLSCARRSRTAASAPSGCR